MTEVREARYRHFCAWCLAICLTWGILLPRLGEWSPLQSAIQGLDDQGIDPSAMYYTDLDIMPQVQADMDRLRRQHPEAFWRPAAIRNAP